MGRFAGLGRYTIKIWAGECGGTNPSLAKFNPILEKWNNDKMGRVEIQISAHKGNKRKMILYHPCQYHRDPKRYKSWDL